MRSKESRIIVAGLVLGAAIGGITVMLLRLRDARREQTTPEPISNILKEFSWPEVLSIAAAAMALARRISGLPALPTEESKR